MQDRSAALDRLVLTLTGKPVPRICFLPTASGDGRDQTTRFHERFSGWPCEPSVLSLFHLGRDRIDPRAHLLAQDAIYVGGGSMRNMLAVWREHGVDETMRSAWERGIVLAGLSAGAMCWFESGITMSGGAPRPAAGLGLLEGSLSVHLDGEPERLPGVPRARWPPARCRRGSRSTTAPRCWSCGTSVSRCVSSRPGARVLRVEADGDGGTVERPMTVRGAAGGGGGRCADRAPGSRAACRSCGRCGPGATAGTDRTPCSRATGRVSPRRWPCPGGGAAGSAPRPPARRRR